MHETIGIPRASQQDAAYGFVLLIAKGVHFPL